MNSSRTGRPMDLHFRRADPDGTVTDHPVALPCQIGGLNPLHTERWNGVEIDPATCRLDALRRNGSDSSSTPAAPAQTASWHPSSTDAVVAGESTATGSSPA